ncbi:hypothetical protein D3C86_1349860 [compost metagenome]
MFITGALRGMSRRGTEMNSTIKPVPYSTTSVASASQPVWVAGRFKPPGRAPVMPARLMLLNTMKIVSKLRTEPRTSDSL